MLLNFTVLMALKKKKKNIKHCNSIKYKAKAMCLYSPVCSVLMAGHQVICDITSSDNLLHVTK